ncbi:P-loop containing nucleoside triphosphate hydrolase protein [Rhodotorula sp. JG-1b]|nr:P-loop containing nucleoside triphosphate hydrolase protein [Rhodotorula sp. JG-1b]
MPMNAHAAARLRAKKRARSSAAAEQTDGTASSAQPAPRAKRMRTAAPKDLGWKSIVLPAELGFDDDGGLLELDEVEGVDVVYEDGRVAFKVREDAPNSTTNEASTPAKKGKGKAVEPEEDEWQPVTEGGVAEADEGEEPAFDDDEVLEFPPEEEDIAAAAAQSKTSPAGPETSVSEGPKKEKKGKGKKAAAGGKVQAPAVPLEEEDFDAASQLPGWAHLQLANPLYRALAESGFASPTEIQERALKVNAPAQVTDAHESAFAAPHTERDLVGIAQTGSGKTLAYGLPILSHILSQAEPSAARAASPSGSTTSSEDDLPPTRLAALILCPTRELALQVRQALSSLAVRTLPLLPSSPETDKLAPEDPRRRQKGRLIQVVALTGGMSVDKQKRQLEKGADIVVATPGRLWDLIGESDLLVREIKGMKFLVIDEADRMIENGHFAELDNIVKLTRRSKDHSENAYVDDFDNVVTSRSNANTLPVRPDMRTFVFSATMSKELQLNLKRKGGTRKFIPRANEGEMTSLDDLLDKLDFRDPDPEIIDLSPEHGLVDTLKECKIECLKQEKDVYLYHFLVRYPARTIVFLASIDGIRRLHPLLALLKVNVIPLHSGMQQRQRLKALDKFKSSLDGVLLATDVAARGLDIPAVSHVVHYQLPRAADTYVHRSGRTARAGTAGLALQLVAPEEKKVQRMLMASLGKADDLPSLPTDFSILDQLKRRIDLAKQVDQAQHKLQKEAHDDKWLRETAEAMDIELEDDQDSDGDAPRASSKKERSKKAYQARALRQQLDELLRKPLMVRGISAKYLTTRNKVGLVDQLVGGTSHNKIFGLDQSSALEDLARAPRERKKARNKKKKDEEAAEEAAEPSEEEESP